MIQLNLLRGAKTQCKFCPKDICRLGGWGNGRLFFCLLVWQITNRKNTNQAKRFLVFCHDPILVLYKNLHVTVFLIDCRLWILHLLNQTSKSPSVGGFYAQVVWNRADSRRVSRDQLCLVVFDTLNNSDPHGLNINQFFLNNGILIGNFENSTTYMYV